MEKGSVMAHKWHKAPLNSGVPCGTEEGSGRDTADRHGIVSEGNSEVTGSLLEMSSS